MWNFADSPDAAHWDELVAAHGGHPLQTALWADARAKADGMRSERLLLRRDGRPVLLASVEVRRHAIAGKVAWTPQGPIYVDAQWAYDASRVLKAELKARGYQLCFENPYPEAPSRYPEHGIAIGGPAYTSIVDLSVGEEALWNGLSSNWRNNVRAAERGGIGVSEARDVETIRQFVSECERLSVARRFRYQGSEALVTSLLQDRGHGHVHAKLHCASQASGFRGGVLVMIVGKTMQLMFSAVGRGEPSPGRLLQWTAMRAAIAADVTRYDLGGVDPEGNPGVYEFKRQLRGMPVTIPPIRASALTLRGRAALTAGSLLRRV